MLSLSGHILLRLAPPQCLPYVPSEQASLVFCLKSCNKTLSAEERQLQALQVPVKEMAEQQEKIRSAGSDVSGQITMHNAAGCVLHARCFTPASETWSATDFCVHFLRSFQGSLKAGRVLVSVSSSQMFAGFRSLFPGPLCRARLSESKLPSSSASRRLQRPSTFFCSVHAK